MNENLISAKAAKKDEFYTRYEDIEEELKHYPDAFRGKTVYCNCDDYRKSNFVKFFLDHFEEYGLKRLIATCYVEQSLFSTEKPVYLDYDGVTKKTGELKGDGDFRSMECRKYLAECDIVVTNPPFSLFREFIELMKKY